MNIFQTLGVILGLCGAWGCCAHIVLRDLLANWDIFEKELVRDDALCNACGQVPQPIKLLCIVFIGVISPLFVAQNIHFWFRLLPTRLRIQWSKFRIWRSTRAIDRINRLTRVDTQEFKKLLQDYFEEK